MFNRTLNNTRHLEVDLVTGITFADWENQLLLLGASNFQLSLNIGTTINSIGTSLNNLGNYSGILTTTLNHTINDLSNYEILNSVSIGTISQQVGTSISNLQVTNQSLQNEIDALILAGVSVENIDLSYGISIAILDSKIGNQLGVTNTLINANVIALSTSYTNVETNKADKLQCGISMLNLQSNLNSVSTTCHSNYIQLGISINQLDTSYGNYRHYNDININTLQSLSVSHDTRISILEAQEYSLGISTGNLNIETSHLLTDVSGLKYFCYGATYIGISSSSPTTWQTIQQIADDITYAYDALQTAQLGYQAYQAIQNGSFSAFVAQQTGYNVLNDAENVTQDTNIASNSTAIGANVVAIAGLVAGTIVTNINVASNTSDITTLNTNLTNLSNVVSTNNTNVLNYETANNTNISNIGTTLTNNLNSINAIGTTLALYTGRVKITPLGITFKGATVDMMNIDDIGVNVTGNLTVSGTFVSPLTSQLGISLTNEIINRNALGISAKSTDVSLGVLGVSLAGYLPNNSIELPPSFQTASLGTLKTVDNIVVSSTGANSYLLYTNAYTDATNLVGMINTNLRIRNGGPSGGIQFQTNGPYTRVSIDSLGNCIASFNLTVSGTFQSPLTSQLGVSANTLETNKLDTILAGITLASIGASFSNVNSLGVSHRNLITDLGTSSGALENGKADKLLVSVSYTGIIATGISHLNYINQIGISTGNSPSFGVSISNVDVKTGQLIGITLASIGASFSNVNSLGVSHRNLITDLGTSSGALENGKADKLLVSVSYAGVIATGISHLNLINQIGISTGNSPSFGVSIGNVDVKTGQLIGITCATINNQLSTFLATTWANFKVNEMGVSTIKFQPTLGDKIILYQDNTGNIGFGITNGTFVIHTNDNVTDVSIGCNSAGGTFVGYTEIMKVKASTQTAHILNSSISGTFTSPLTTTLGTSSVALENSKADKLLVSVSYTGIIATGISHLNSISTLGTSSIALESNKMDKALVGVSMNNIDSALRNGTIGDTWGTTSASKIINTSDNVTVNSSGANSYFQFRGSTKSIK